jgi:hypothetical protein
MMVESGGTPRDYGLKVVSHPVLMVTSRLKMRAAKSLYLSFSGHVIETTVLHRQQKRIHDNHQAFLDLVAAMGHHGKPNPVQKRPDSEDRWNGIVWTDVAHEHVTDFLGAYSTHSGAPKANSQLLRDFIESMVRENELRKWTVALIGGSVSGDLFVLDGVTVQRAERAAKSSNADRYSIGRLLSPKDEGIDMGREAWEAALAETRKVWKEEPGRLKNKKEPDVPNGPALRKVRGYGAPGVPAHPERGVLLLYLLQPPKFDDGGPKLDATPVVAFGISFPGSKSGTKVEYKVNNVLWEQEYADAA